MAKAAPWVGGICGSGGVRCTWRAIALLHLLSKLSVNLCKKAYRLGQHFNLVFDSLSGSSIMELVVAC